MSTSLPRSKVKKNQTWNSESVFATPKDFDVAVTRLVESLPSIQTFKGRLSEGPDTFIETMTTLNEISERAAKVQVYATMSSAVDTSDQLGASMNGKAMSALAQAGAATSFIDPELLAIGETTLRQWIINDPRMKAFEFYFNDLFRKDVYKRQMQERS